jgi:hypothetical protein
MMAIVDQFRVAKKVPFRPFRFRMADGREYAVDHPDWITVPPVRRPREVWFFALVEGGDPNEYETHRIDLALVSEVIFPPNGQAPPVGPTSEGNGPEVPRS